MISQNADRYENVIIRNNKEIGINTFGLDYLVSLEKEIERLNNIIKEFEKFMIDVKQFAYLDKLQELKGSDKE